MADTLITAADVEAMSQMFEAGGPRSEGGERAPYWVLVGQPIGIDANWSTRERGAHDQENTERLLDHTEDVLLPAFITNWCSEANTRPTNTALWSYAKPFAFRFPLFRAELDIVHEREFDYIKSDDDTNWTVLTQATYDGTTLFERSLRRRRTLQADGLDACIVPRRPTRDSDKFMLVVRVIETAKHGQGLHLAERFIQGCMRVLLKAEATAGGGDLIRPPHTLVFLRIHTPLLFATLKYHHMALAGPVPATRSILGTVPRFYPAPPDTLEFSANAVIGEKNPYITHENGEKEPAAHAMHLLWSTPRQWFHWRRVAIPWRDTRRRRRDADEQTDKPLACAGKETPLDKPRWPANASLAEDRDATEAHDALNAYLTNGQRGIVSLPGGMGQRARVLAITNIDVLADPVLCHDTRDAEQFREVAEACRRLDARPVSQHACPAIYLSLVWPSVCDIARERQATHTEDQPNTECVLELSFLVDYARTTHRPIVIAAGTVGVLRTLLAVPDETQVAHSFCIPEMSRPGPVLYARPGGNFLVWVPQRQPWPLVSKKEISLKSAFANMKMPEHEQSFLDPPAHHPHIRPYREGEEARLRKEARIRKEKLPSFFDTAPAPAPRSASPAPAPAPRNASPAAAPAPVPRNASPAAAPAPVPRNASPVVPVPARRVRSATTHRVTGANAAPGPRPDPVPTAIPVLPRGPIGHAPQLRLVPNVEQPRAPRFYPGIDTAPGPRSVPAPTPTPTLPRGLVGHAPRLVPSVAQPSVPPRLFPLNLWVKPRSPPPFDEHGVIPDYLQLYPAPGDSNTHDLPVGDEAPLTPLWREEGGGNFLEEPPGTYQNFPEQQQRQQQGRRQQEEAPNPFADELYGEDGGFRVDDMDMVMPDR